MSRPETKGKCHWEGCCAESRWVHTHALVRRVELCPEHARVFIADRDAWTKVRT